MSYVPKNINSYNLVDQFFDIRVVTTALDPDLTMPVGTLWQLETGAMQFSFNILVVVDDTFTKLSIFIVR